MWIDETALEADVKAFISIVKPVAALIPGARGNMIVAALEALLSPTVMRPVVAAFNAATGAEPPTDG